MPTVAISRLFRAQGGLATRAQLQDAGLTPRTVRAHVEAERWQSLNHVVVCLHNGPLTDNQKRWAVYLSAQGPAALCGLTAMQLWRVTGFETADVHVVVRRGLGVLPVPTVRIVIHESRRFMASDVFTARSPAVTSLERAVVDAAVWTADLTTACRIVVAPVQQRRTTAARIAAELARAGQVRHRRQLAALLADMAGGAEALSEIEFLRFCRRHRLPRPTCQVRLDAGGRRRFLDAIFELADGTIVRVEIDGGVHLSLTARWRDTAKDNDALLDGVAVLRFPSVAIYTDDPLAVRQLRRALATCQAHRSP